MIFVTVGTQLPFDRMVMALDKWAGTRKDIEIFAQIGEGGRKPKHIKFKEKLSPKEFTFYFDQAELIVAHVGMGTIIAGLENAKPMVLLPRRRKLGEHRSDHQLDTAKSFSKFELISIVEEEEMLGDAVAKVLQKKLSADKANLSASPQLLEGIRSFVLAR